MAQKPASGGMPAMASQPMVKVTVVHCMTLRSAPMRLRSCSLSSPWITEPAPRKRRPLKKAWATMRKMAAM